MFHKKWKAGCPNRILSLRTLDIRRLRDPTMATSPCNHLSVFVLYVPFYYLLLRFKTSEGSTVLLVPIQVKVLYLESSIPEGSNYFNQKKEAEELPNSPHF